MNKDRKIFWLIMIYILGHIMIGCANLLAVAIWIIIETSVILIYLIAQTLMLVYREWKIKNE